MLRTFLLLIAGLVLSVGTSFSAMEPTKNTPVPFAVTLTAADTQYSFNPQSALGITQRIKEIWFVLDSGEEFRYAWTTGLVATPTGSYIPVPAGYTVELDGLDILPNFTIYFASDSVSAPVVRGEVLY